MLVLAEVRRQTQTFSPAEIVAGAANNSNVKLCVRSCTPSGTRPTQGLQNNQSKEKNLKITHDKVPHTEKLIIR